MKHGPSNEMLCEGAALYALGALDPTDVPAFEAHLTAGCARCLDELAALANVVDDLALAATPLGGSSSVRGRLLGEVRRVGRQVEETATAAPSDFAFLGAEEGEWLEVQPGILRKDLAAGGATSAASYLIRMQAGAVAATHIHAGTEHCYVIEGDLVIGDRKITAGDFHLAAGGTEHIALRSDGGCLLLIVEAPA